MQRISRTLTSLEVAELMGRTHKKVLESIRLYISQMQEVEKKNGTGTKEGWLKYFIESTYIAGNGQEQPCYNVTKIGCEFLAHKLKGIKGTEFTMRYIDRFHEMEETIATPKLPQNTMELLELHYQALKEVDSKVDSVSSEVQTVKEDFEKFKLDLPILGVEENKISNAVRRRGVECLGGKESNAYKDKSVRGRLYIDIHKQLRREFDVSSYKAIKRSQCDTAIAIINKYEPPLVLAETIETLNAQQIMDL